MMKKKQKEENITKVLTAGEIVEELRKLPKQAEVRYADVCGNLECELYEIHIDAVKGIVYLIGDEKNEL